jgi:hypothetical protein
MLNNESCFLEEPVWEAALLRTVKEGGGFSPRSQIGIFVASRMARMTGIFKEVTHAVCQADTISSEAVETLIFRALELQNDLKQCRTKFQQLATASRSTPSADDARTEILGLSYTISVIVNRLLGAIWPEARDRLEDEALEWATELRALDDQTGTTNAKASFYLAQKNWVMDSTIRTTALWRDRKGEEGTIIEKWKFDAWCNAIPRKTCDGKQCRPKH